MSIFNFRNFVISPYYKDETRKTKITATSSECAGGNVLSTNDVNTPKWKSDGASSYGIEIGYSF